MGIIQAEKVHTDIVNFITQETIDIIYPKYYPMGAVRFFKVHHNDSNILTDIENKYVYLLQKENVFVGTVTIKDNEICRLFVLPNFQHRGYGQQLLDFAESKIKDNYSKILLDASLPAKRIYQLRGYREIEYHQIKTENGDILCYDVMSK